METKTFATSLFYACVLLSATGEIKDVKANSLLGSGQHASLLDVNLLNHPNHASAGVASHSIATQNAQPVVFLSESSSVEPIQVFALSDFNSQPINKGNFAIVASNGQQFIAGSPMTASTNENLILANKNNPLIVANVASNGLHQHQLSNSDALILANILDNSGFQTDSNDALIEIN